MRLFFACFCLSTVSAFTIKTRRLTPRQKIAAGATTSVDFMSALTDIATRRPSVVDGSGIEFLRFEEPGSNPKEVLLYVPGLDFTGASAAGSNIVLV